MGDGRARVTDACDERERRVGLARRFLDLLERRGIEPDGELAGPHRHPTTRMTSVVLEQPNPAFVQATKRAFDPHFGSLATNPA